MRVDDPGMPFDSRNEGSTCACPWRTAAAAAAAPLQAGVLVTEAMVAGASAAAACFAGLLAAVPAPPAPAALHTLAAVLHLWERDAVWASPSSSSSSTFPYSPSPSSSDSGARPLHAEWPAVRGGAWQILPARSSTRILNPRSLR